MKQLSPRTYLILIISLCFISRLPQLLSPYLILDGDECLVAMMAKYWYECKDFSLFFWGQQYGFTFFESTAIIPFQSVFGMGTVPVKLAMLCLWTVGIVFFYKTALCINKNNYTQAFLLTLVFIFTPAWAVWSMKARGGYLTSFMLSSIILYLLFNKKTSARNASYFIIGILLNFVYQSQPLWLLGLVPLIIYSVASNRNLKGFLLMLLPLVLLLILFYFYKKTLPPGYNPPFIIPTADNIWVYVQRIPEFLYISLHGSYYFFFIQRPNVFQAFDAVIFIVLICMLLFIAIFQLLFRRKGQGLFISSVIFIPAYLILTLFVPSTEGRYLLPVTGFCLLSLQVYLAKLKTGKIFNIVVASVIAAGVVSVITFWNFIFLPGTKRTFLQTLNYLEQNGVHYTFCVHTMLNWQIVYYSDERIISRIQYVPGRWPAHMKAVDSAHANGVTTAIFGHAGGGPNAKDIRFVNEYLITINPTKEELAAASFEFEESK